jgi:anti-sigma-K factor RskA
MNYRDPTLRTRLADEYVLGTLQGAARRRFERLLRHDDALRMTVQKAGLRWNVLVETLPPVQPSAALWHTIQQRIAPARQVPARPWRQLGFWRGWALAASALAVLLILYIHVVPWPTTYVVIITDDAQARASWLLSVAAAGREVRVNALAPQPLPADHAFQLWAKLPGAATVQSVGLIPAAGRTIIPVPEPLVPNLAQAEKFGVSIEPPGGSPTGQPTTTPLYHGSAPVQL